MAAPDTNLEKQKRRHRGPLIGMGVSVVFVAVLLFWLFGTDSVETPPDGSGSEIDGSTGEQTDQAPPASGQATED